MSLRAEPRTAPEGENVRKQWNTVRRGSTHMPDPKASAAAAAAAAPRPKPTLRGAVHKVVKESRKAKDAAASAAAAMPALPRKPSSRHTTPGRGRTVSE